MRPPKKDLFSLRNDALLIFNSAIQAVHAEKALKRHCHIVGDLLKIDNLFFNLDQFQHIYTIGAGKATAHMAKAIEDLCLSQIADGIIMVKYGHTVPLKKIRQIEAGHPIPDENGLKGAMQIIDLAKEAGTNDLIICLISGGGSALLVHPTPPLTLADKQNTIKILLASGASIDEINTLRKHMSDVKGGWLAQKAHPATLITLVLSDVTGDRLDMIASGPTVPDPTSFQDCMNIINAYQLKDKLPGSVVNHVSAGIAGEFEETPKPGDPVFDSSTNQIVGNNMDALTAAKQTADSLGYHSMILSSMIEGNTRDAALFHTAIAKQIRKTGNPIPPPACILSGGETTVVLTGNGLGGRNQEFALAVAMEIEDQKDMVVLCAGTDGTDGPTDAAGAVVDTNTLKTAKVSGIDATKSLKNNDSFHFFKKINNLLVTGPTGTNVMDLRIMLIG